MNLFLIGYYGYQNIGDEAILQVLVEKFRAGLNYPRIYVLTADPEETTRNYNVISVARHNPLRMLHTIRNSDVLILGGGSLLQDVTGQGLTAFYYLLFMFFAKFFKKKVVFLAQGVGPIRRSFTRKLAAFILNRMDFISVRENESKRFLRGIGVKGKINLIPDPVLLAHILPATAQARQYLGISLRPGFFPNLALLAEQLDRVISALNLKIIFFSFQKNADDVVIQKVRLVMKQAEHTSVCPADAPMEEIIEKIGSCQIFVGTRLHSLVFAAKKKIPFLGLNYDPKIGAFCTTLGMPYLNLFEVEYLTESIQGLWDRKEQLLKILKRKMDAWQKLAKLGMEKCINYIKA